MASKQEPRSLVYRTFNEAVPEDVIQSPKLKSVTAFVQERRQAPDTSALIDKYGLGSTCITLHQLDVEGKLKAKPTSLRCEKPQLKRDNVAIKQSEKPEIKATKQGEKPQVKHDKMAFKQGKMKIEDDTDSEDTLDPLNVGEGTRTRGTDEVVTLKGNSAIENPPTQISLDPVRIPYDIQYHLLRKVQDSLEVACYTFAHQRWPTALESSGICCPEAGELQCWPRFFRSQPASFDSQALKAMEKDLHLIYGSIIELRHFTVHRDQAAAQQVEELLSDAEAFATLLCQQETVETISDIRKVFRSAMCDIEQNSEALKASLDQIHQDFASQRAHIDQLEIEACKQVREVDNKYRRLVARKIEFEIFNGEERLATPGLKNTQPKQYLRKMGELVARSVQPLPVYLVDAILYWIAR